MEQQIVTEAELDREIKKAFTRREYSGKTRVIARVPKPNPEFGPDKLITLFREAVLRDKFHVAEWDTVRVSTSLYMCPSPHNDYVKLYAWINPVDPSVTA